MMYSRATIISIICRNAHLKRFSALIYHLALFVATGLMRNGLIFDPGPSQNLSIEDNAVLAILRGHLAARSHIITPNDHQAIKGGMAEEAGRLAMKALSSEGGSERTELTKCTLKERPPPCCGGRIRR